LAEIADRTGVPVLLVRHLKKGETNNVLYRGGGSIGIIGAARSGILIERDPDDADRRLFATFKSNLSKPAPTLAYRLVGSPSDPEVALVEWEIGTDPRTADQILAATAERYEQKSERGDARAFLKDFFAERKGAPAPYAEVWAAAKSVGIKNERTLSRAANDVGVNRVKVGFGKDGAWMWSLG
jgi:hypothetical protein